jgi:hypothetical protein
LYFGIKIEKEWEKIHLRRRTEISGSADVALAGSEGTSFPQGKVFAVSAKTQNPGPKGSGAKDQSTTKVMITLPQLSLETV